MAAAELKTQPSQPSSAPKRSAKRVADSQMGIDDLSASATPASKRECPSPAAVASPGTESKYKVVVKPHTSMESVETRTYKCGLCQTDDHEITSKDCPVKQKALKARRQRKRRQRSVTQEERDADIPTSNRFELLSPSEEDTPALVEPENACYEVPTYSDAVKRGKKRVQQPANTPKLSVTGTDDLAKLDQQIQQLQMEVKRLAQRRTHLARPAGPTAMRGTDVPYAASVPELSCASASAPVKMTPAELLHLLPGNCKSFQRWCSPTFHRNDHSFESNAPPLCPAVELPGTCK
ncbi:hypothetical protein HPB51_003227 [Rhipicephalus microplus]|uniref:Uncharacterized protein n=1 Tax=Rhipicephalus microplus TaxID=6941 RepID=A0A9J6EEP0_RHIMP|nr:hypothetical protein HPB51_003227 [Rhipicephalus microplus]